ncbi:MAG: hypothetical protein ACYTGN_04430 [Planctomycetota bacterium]
MDDPVTSQAPPAAEPEGRADPVGAFREMQLAEKILVAAALGVLVAFTFAGHWTRLFSGRWFITCAAVGSVGTLVLAALDMFGMKPVKRPARTYLMVFLALVPALGFVIDRLIDFWDGMVLAGAVAMAYAAARITTRDNLI